MVDANKAALENFQKITEFQVIRILGRLLGDPKGEIEVKPFPDNRLLYFDHIVFICIMNQSVRITFRIHFLDRDAREFWALANSKPPISVTDYKVVDYLKEFCNILSGSVRAVLNEGDIYVGQSLPVYVAGFNELFFSAIFENQYSRSTEFKFGKVSLVSSLNIEFLQPAISEELANLPCDFDELVPPLESF